MKLWIRRIFVFLVSIITLGVYIPPAEQNTNIKEEKGILSSNEIPGENGESSDSIAESGYPSTSPQKKDNTTVLLTNHAKEQVITKMGPRIFPHVENEFMEVILPAMEEVLTSLVVETGPEEASYFTITNQPTGGYGEKIFHVYDMCNEKDIVRFHVRRDKRPLEGYWFNFHYHLGKDNFEEHHELGEIYWSKDDPPKWVA